ncbi:MAG: FAD binding domain-containing protein [Candidatus Thorarchaeota archaeon]
MITEKFDYVKANTLSDAISLLTQYKDDAKILSGGMSLVPMMKLRLAAPKYIIDINGLSDLDFITESDGHLKIGGLTRESELEKSNLVRSKYQIIYETTKMIADPQVRNRATIGGNLAHGDPANDHPATLLALNANVVATGPNGKRTIPISQFFTDIFTTALESNEILTEVQVPVPEPNSGGAYFKLERKVGDYATAGVAAHVVLSGDGKCQRAGIGLTNVGSVPIKAKNAENFLVGKNLDMNTINEAAKLAAEESNPNADLRGSVEYKKAMVKELTKRALTKALERAKGGN